MPASELPIIEINEQNIENEHICCALGNTPDAKACTAAKKAWMRAAYPLGYRFWRLDARGKALLEAIPGQRAWCPVEAEGWLFLDCFWVSGQFKHQGVARRLFEKALDHAKSGGMEGLVALAGEKKMPFLSDGALYRHLGFEMADTAPGGYQLLALPLEAGAPLPRFAASAKKPPVDGENGFSAQGFTVYWSDHCPHPSKYLPLLKEAAEEAGVAFHAHKLTNYAEAQAAPNPFPTWAMYYNGQLVGNEIFSVAKLLKFIEENGKSGK